MAGALYVSNPRRARKSRVKRRNPAVGGGVYEGGFDDLFDDAPRGRRKGRNTAVLAADVARILAGDKPMTASERRIARAEAGLSAMQKRVAQQRRMAQTITELEPQATLLAAREIALKRALRAVGGSAPKRRRKAASKRRKSRRGTRRSNPFMGLNLSGLTLANPRRRKGTKRRGTKRRRYSRRPARNTKGRYVASGRRGVRARGRRSRNPLSISNPLSGVPVLGSMVGLMLPAVFGAIGVELIGQSTKLLEKYVAIPEMIQPFKFTVGGLILGAVVQLVTPIPAPYRHSLSLALASAGGAVDAYRYRSVANSAYGDGGSWSVEYGDDEAFGALDFSGIEFSGDEDYCGHDFSVEEGEAAAEGYGAYQARFPLKRPGQHDPRRQGDRFHWLAKRVGPEGFRKIAHLPPDQRLQMIARVKQSVKHAPMDVPRQIAQVDRMESVQALPDPRSLTIPFVQDSWAI